MDHAVDDPGNHQTTHESVLDRFEQIVTDHGDRLAIVTDAHQWTYQRLNEMANALAVQINAIPETEAQPIALLMEHGALLIAAMLAVMKVGRASVVLDAGDSPERRNLTYQSCAASTLLVDAPHADEGKRLTSEIGRLVEINEHPAVDHGMTTTNPQIAPDAIASILFTSGSTGRPKGVCQSHAMTLHHCGNYTQIANITTADRLSLLTPCHLAASRSALWGALLNGATLFPFDLRVHGVAELPRWIDTLCITVLHCVPAVFRTLASILDETNDEHSLDSIRLLRLGGESVLARDLELYRRFTHRDCKLMVAFSSTETGMVLANVLSQDTRITGQHVPLGKAINAMDVRLVDDRGEMVSIGEIGQMIVTSRYLASGYWGDADLTAARFTPDPHDAVARVFQTGDLARLNSEGQYEYCGRNDARRKIRGHRVDLAEVEASLLRCPGISESVVIERTNPAGQNELVGFVVAGPANYAGERGLRESLQKTLAAHMVPSTFVRLDSMPRAATGKIDRHALSGYQLNAATQESEPNDQPLWRQIASMWEEMLGKGPVDEHVDFFHELGVTSLQAASAVVKLERITGLRISLATLMRYRTPRTLADCLAAPAEGNRSKLLLVQPGQPGIAPFFFVHGDVYGAGLYCPRLARLIGVHRPFYALPPMGFDRDTALRSFPTMARAWISEIRRVQPSGPYLIGGFCNGGALAFEIARQLQHRGQKVASLILIRAKVGTIRWPGVRNLIENFGDCAGLSSDARLDLYWRVLEGMGALRHASAALRRGNFRSAWQSLLRPGNSGDAVFARGSIQQADAVMEMHRRAAQTYQPGAFDGRLHLIWPSEDRASVRQQSISGWRRFARELSVQDVPGGHHTCITQHVETLAMRLRQILDEVDP